MGVFSGNLSARLLCLIIPLLLCSSTLADLSQPNLCGAFRDLSMVPTMNITFENGNMWFISLCKRVDFTVNYCVFNASYPSFIGGWSPQGSCTGYWPNFLSIHVNSSAVTLQYGYGGYVGVIFYLSCGPSIALTNVTVEPFQNLPFKFHARSFAACL